MDELESRVKGCPIGCLVYCLGIPLLIIAVLFIVLIINNRPPHVKVPPQKLPNPNAWNYFVKAAKMLPNGSKAAYGPCSSAEPMNSWTMAEYEQYMRLNAPALAVFRQGLSRPYMCPRPKSYYDLHFEQYARFREIARRLSSEALYYEKIGKYGLAASSALDAVDLGVTIPKGGPMIDALVGVAVESIGAKRLEEILPELSPDEMTSVAGRLDTINRKRTMFADIMTEEAYTTALITAKMYGKADFRRQVMDPRNWIGLDSLRKPRQLWTDLSNVFSNKQNMIDETQEYYEAVAKEQKRPYTGRSHIPVPSNPLTEGYYIYGSNMAITTRTAYSRAEAMSTLLQTEVALRRYRFDHGSYPSKLADVSPKYLKRIPIDPFGNGRPLRYKSIKNGKDFLLYSLGPNLKDDRGIRGDWITPLPWEHSAARGDLAAGKW